MQQVDLYLPLTPIADTKLKLLLSEGFSLTSLGTVTWVNTGQEVVRVTNQILHPALCPFDDSAEDWIDLYVLLDTWETENPETTQAVWMLLYNPVDDTEHFQVFAAV